MIKQQATAAAATPVIDNLEYVASRTSPIMTVLRGVAYSVCAFVVLGLLAFIGWSVVTAFGAGIQVSKAAHNLASQAAANPVCLAILFGLLGGVVSILLRITEFEVANQRQQRSKQFLLATGFVLPAVGAMFAAVACGVFASGLVSFAFAGESATTAKLRENVYFFVVIGFLAGFSERFMRGLLGRVEQGVSASENKREIEAMPDRTVKGSQTVRKFRSGAAE